MQNGYLLEETIGQFVPPAKLYISQSVHHLINEYVTVSYSLFSQPLTVLVASINSLTYFCSTNS